MDQDHTGIAGLLGIARPSGTDQPRLTLVPARCAVGISASGAGFRVIHTMSGRELGIVYRKGIGPHASAWCNVCPKGCGPSEADYPTAHSAATALSAHMLDHGLALVRARLEDAEAAHLADLSADAVHHQDHLSSRDRGL
jgi:hypothetical protein